ncbi:MAG: shikimate dehydrogenase [Gammaproteobacteria bacterium]|nr:shikimate dehydrogenase [Gammaproteobacteria bacterium]
MKQDQYAVMGNPIAHSKSPFIHSLFARQTGQNLNYSSLLVEIDAFESSVNAFAKNKGKGLNITVPFKQQAWQLVNERSRSAEKAGAVNTITIHESGKLTGDNTDGIGLVNDLRTNLKFELKNKKILVLGAGGAVRGVLGPLLDENPELVVVANRTIARAVELEQLFSEDGNIKGVGFEDLESNAFDLVINGTAASLNGDLPPIPASTVHNACCYDMMYSKEDTVFMAWAREHEAKQVWDGLGMLVEQAAESFFIWRGVRPDTAEVISQVRDAY